MKKEAKPNTGMKEDSKLVGFLKALSKDTPTSNMPQMPEPTFDKEMGGMFKKKKARK